MNPKAVLVVAMVVVAGTGIGLAASGSGKATGHPAPPEVRQPAVANMAALGRASTAVSNAAIPAAIRQLPADVAPRQGQVHRLLATLGNPAGTIYAWVDGRRVCHETAAGVGGCFSDLVNSFNWSVSDVDALGSGQPTVVTGFVSDAVVGVDVVVNGKASPATVVNNGMFYALPDASLLPASIDAFVVHFADGSTKTLPHETAPLPGR